MSSQAFNELYHRTEQNAEILASASAYFCQSYEDKQARQKFGRAFSKLLILSTHANALTLKLDDGGAGQTYSIPPKSSFSIASEEGRFFSSVKITASSAGAVAAGEVTIDFSITVPA